MPAQQSSFTRGYNSFSGVDIKATFGSKTVGSLQGISYSVSREKAPIYTMGEPDPRAFARGKRGIAGSLVFAQFNMEPLMAELANLTDTSRQLFFLSDIDSLRPDYSSADMMTVATTNVVAGAGSSNTPGALITSQESDVTNAASDQAKAIPWYPDQIPPFDVCLTAANEYGMLAIMKILGLELLNNGYGVSVDDIMSEHSYTYVAHGLIPWMPQGVNGMHPDMVTP